MKNLSEEQLEKLVELEETLDLPAVALVIKDTKIGQGLKFFPRKMTDLVKSLQTLLTELVETGSSTVRNNVMKYIQYFYHPRYVIDFILKSILSTKLYKTFGCKYIHYPPPPPPPRQCFGMSLKEPQITSTTWTSF